MRIDHQPGRYLARLAQSTDDVRACQMLRHQCFFGEQGLDEDSFDQHWQHILVEDGSNGDLVCTFRYRIFQGEDVYAGYAAHHYDLSAIARLEGPLIEIGRFCSDPARLDPHILRVAWGALTKIVDGAKAEVVYGCTSFLGGDPAAYADVFAHLRDRHVGPKHLLPDVSGPGRVMLADVKPGTIAQNPMPPLLRTYLAMGGWVGDHAVIDREMQTLHVFTALEIAAVPPARAKALRALV